MRKRQKWIGLTALFALLFSMTVSLSSSAFYYSGYVNSFLGLTGQTIAIEGDTNYFPSAYGELNAENGGPLKGKGKYEARIACNLWAKDHATGRVDGANPKKRLRDHPYFTQSGKDREENGDQYIANMRDGATAGFKYFLFDGTETRIRAEGRGSGGFLVSDGQKTVADVPVNGEGAFRIDAGVHPLFFEYRGEGPADFLSFEIR